MTGGDPFMENLSNLLLEGTLKVYKKVTKPFRKPEQFILKNFPS